jgi:Zn-dependent protease
LDVDWTRVVLLLAVVAPSVILHEISHGAVALALGDDTAKRAGRLTLNPIAHIDPFGTLLLPLMLSLSGVGAFGYAKPVPVNVRNLRDPRRHSLWVSLAGPAVNLALALVATVLLKTVFHDELYNAFYIDDLPLVVQWVFWLGFANVALAVFNLLPIPPLDGSALVERVLPAHWWPTWLRFRPYGMGIVLLFVLLAPNRVFDPIFTRWLDLL